MANWILMTIKMRGPDYLLSPGRKRQLTHVQSAMLLNFVCAERKLKRPHLHEILDQMVILEWRETQENTFNHLIRCIELIN